MSVIDDVAFAHRSHRATLDSFIDLRPRWQLSTAHEGMAGQEKRSRCSGICGSHSCHGYGLHGVLYKVPIGRIRQP